MRLPRTFDHALLTVLVATIITVAATPPGLTTKPVARERNFKFEYVVTIRQLPADGADFQLWLPVPHNDPYQQISRLRIESPVPYKVHKSQFGNTVLYLKTKDLKQKELTVKISFDAQRREHLNPAAREAGAATLTDLNADPEMNRWLQADRLVPLDDKVRGWAQEVVQQANARTDLEKARAIYHHIVATVKYDKTGKGWGRGDIYYACDARRGNCTDFHAIFIGYCRAVGIPARFSIGFPLPKDRGEGQISGYHCWAECYIKGIGWIPVDASEAAKDPARREYFFGAHDENRIEFTRGRDLVLNPKQAGQPLNYFIYPYAEVNGQPFTDLVSTFRYHDLTTAN